MQRRSNAAGLLPRAARQYPFPYGFVLETTNEDGGNVDCFVITPRELKTGQIVDCRPVGLMEQIEDGKQEGAALLHKELSRSIIRVYTNGHPIVGAL